MKLIYTLVIAVFLFSCNSEKKVISKKDILDSIFAVFDSVETISYEERFVFSETADTAITYNYYEEAHDSTGYLLSYNCATYRFDKIMDQDVFNSKENTKYYYFQEKTTITDYDNPTKMVGGVEKISWSLLTYIKLLKQTSNNFPERIRIKDTIINDDEFYNIEFSNPEGIPLRDRPMFLLNDTIYPISLIVNKRNSIIKYRTFGKMCNYILNIHLNPNRPDSIWSSTNMPEYFRTKIVDQIDLEVKYLIPQGKIIPNWKFKTIENKDYTLLKESGYSLFVFFSRNCGNCIKEISKLNNLNKISNLKVTGVYFEDDMNELKKFIRKYNIEYEIVLNNDENLKQQFREGVFPVNYLIDNKGKIAYSVLGNRSDLENKVTEIVTKIE
jgi:peroxiredoxin